MQGSAEIGQVQEEQEEDDDDGEEEEEFEGPGMVVIDDAGDQMDE